MIYPWQKNEWQQLWHTKQSDRLPHALLFTGMKGIGKAKFADTFSRAMLCRDINAEGLPCNNCHSCRLIEGRAHPNVLWVEPEKEGQAIKVDAIRELNDFINQSSLQGEYRVAIISPANQMNVNAANALLKTLEEPAANAILILLCDQTEQLPATILSRCQRVLFAKPKSSDALDWLKAQLKDETYDPALLLKLAHGAPLAALQLADQSVFDARRDLFDALYALSQKQVDPIKLAAKQLDIEVLTFIDLTLSWLMDLIRYQLNPQTEELQNIDYKEKLATLAQTTILQSNIDLMNHLQALRKQTLEGINLNKQLLIEYIFIRWG